MKSSESRTNPIPIAMLRNIYKAAIPGCPFFRRLELSSANVENVVKPPQIPTFKNNTRHLKVQLQDNQSFIFSFLWRLAEIDIGLKNSRFISQPVLVQDLARVMERRP